MHSLIWGQCDCTEEKGERKSAKAICAVERQLRGGFWVPALLLCGHLRYILYCIFLEPYLTLFQQTPMSDLNQRDYDVFER